MAFLKASEESSNYELIEQGTYKGKLVSMKTHPGTQTDKKTGELQPFAILTFVIQDDEYYDGWDIDGVASLKLAPLTGEYKAKLVKWWEALTGQLLTDGEEFVTEEEFFESIKDKVVQIVVKHKVDKKGVQRHYIDDVLPIRRSRAPAGKTIPETVAPARPARRIAKPAEVEDNPFTEEDGVPF